MRTSSRRRYTAPHTPGAAAHPRAGTADSARLGHSWMVAAKLGHDPGIVVATLHAQRQRLERPADHPARVWVELGADSAPQLLDRLHQPLAPQRRAGDQIAVAAHVLGQRVHRNIGTHLVVTIR